MTGDRLLEVDGSNLRGVTHQHAVECLKRTGEVDAKKTNIHTHKLKYKYMHVHIHENIIKCTDELICYVHSRKKKC